MSTGIHQDSVIGHPVRLLGEARISRCADCHWLMITLCQKTSRQIKYPVSGPIPDECPLEKAEMI